MENNSNPYVKPVISYGGEMPLVFSNEEYVPRTSDEVEKNRVLSEMLEKKNMINRRLLYLESKRMELLGYYMKIEKSDKGSGAREFLKIFLFLIGAIVVFAIAMLSKKAAVTAAFLMIGFKPKPL